MGRQARGGRAERRRLQRDRVAARHEPALQPDDQLGSHHRHGPAACPLWGLYVRNPARAPERSRSPTRRSPPAWRRRATRRRVHIHAAEDAADERDAEARSGIASSQRLAWRGALDERTLLAHGVHLDDAGDRARRTQPAPPLAHNAALEHEQRGRPRAAGRSATQVALGTDGSAPTCSRSRRPRTSGLREDDVGTAGAWPLARLAEGSAARGADLRRAAARHARARARPPTSSCSTTPRRRRCTPSSFAGHWVFGLSSRTCAT